MENSKPKSEEKSVKHNGKAANTMLDHFSNITNSQENVRQKNSISLLKYLNDNYENSDELKYALGRIIRGLGSSTTSARTGFYSVLVTILNMNEHIMVNSVFEHVKKHLHTAGSNNKSENADICTGQILAYGALIKSNLWSRSSDDEQKQIVEGLMKPSKERSYLGLVAYQFLVHLFEKIDKKGMKRIFPIVKEEISKPWPEQNLDTLYLLCCIQNKYPELITKQGLSNTLGTEEVICSGSLERLCNVLMTFPRITSLQHSTYEIIINEVSESSLLPDFVRQLDSKLDIPNRNKQLLVTKLLTLILERIKDSSVIPELLTRNFIHQTLNYFKSLDRKNQDREFLQMIELFFNQLLTALKHEQVKSTTKIAVLKKLLFSPGTFIFEKITRSKIVQLITQSLDAVGVKDLAIVYKSVVEGEDRVDNKYSLNENWLNNDKLYAAHLLIKLLNHVAVKDQNDWKVQQLIFLMNLGLLKNDTGRQVGIELAASLKMAFFGSLDLKLSKLEDMHSILTRLIRHLDSEISSKNLEDILRDPITEENFEIWQKTTQIINKLTQKLEKKQKKTSLKSVFLTLFLHMGLQVFNDPKLASGSLSELFICYEKTKKSRKKSEDDTNIDNVNESSDPMWIEVVTDLFLNLLSHNSHLLRSIVKSVFGHLCQYMTPTTVQQLVSVLDPRNENNPLSKSGDQSSDDDEEEEDDADSSDAEEEDAGKGSDADMEEEEEIDETVNDKLRMALHQALATNGYQTDEESIDIDQISDTEGEKLDSALADAFKQFKPNRGRRKKQSKDQETLTHFRIRVLDLIEIYLNSEPSMLLTLEIMLPLLQAVEFSIRDEHQVPLLNRLKSTLRILTNLKKFQDTEGVNETVLRDLLNSLLEKGTKNTWIVQDMGIQIADCCIYVIRCSNYLTALEDTPKKTKKHLRKFLAQEIGRELETYFHQANCLTPFVLFVNVMKLNWDGVLKVVSLLLQYVFDEEVKPFKKNQALELLKLFYNNKRYLNNEPAKIKEELTADHECFSENVISLLKSLLNENNVKDRFISNLFDLLSAIKTCGLNIDNIQWIDISEHVREYRSTVSFSKDAKTAFNKLCARLGVSNIVKMKQKTNKLVVNENSGSEHAQINGKKKSKKGTKHEKLKLKKEAKAKRLQSLSQGLGLDFSTTNNVDIEEMNNYVDLDAADDEDHTVEKNVTNNERKKKKKSHFKKTIEEKETKEGHKRKNDENDSRSLFKKSKKI
ncbi:unnamed protein product [Phaedon cochleariae]|uniref:DNA polymerase V n=1 Tax=Phaedon cochleariae TaxID=80249 RepID=A0A9P0DTU0_PHACE|nr:unnamed protein product [Phaedon cochleariae]